MLNTHLDYVFTSDPPAEMLSVYYTASAAISFGPFASPKNIHTHCQIMLLGGQRAATEVRT